MANPQVEDGYTRFANELLEALAALRIPGQELRIVLVIARQTYGWGKKSDKISYGQISNMTGIPRKRVADHVKSLYGKNILSVLNNGDRKPLTIWINKNYEQWQSVPKKGDIPKYGDSTIPNHGDKTVPNKGDHKRKERKERKDPLNISQAYLDKAKAILEYQRDTNGFGKSVEVSKKQVEDSAATLEKLVRLDGFNLEQEVLPALRWAIMESDFWYKQILSLAPLRARSKNGMSKFRNIYAAYLAHTKKQQPDDEVAL
jgi:phage replication O-like protein O